MPLSFDLTLATIPVYIGGRDYVIKEATADVAARWRNSLLNATRLGPDGKPISMENLADSEPFLVSLCLKEVTDKGEVSVGLDVIRSWPAAVVKSLFEEAKKISHLDEKEKKDEERKNS